MPSLAASALRRAHVACTRAGRVPRALGFAGTWRAARGIMALMFVGLLAGCLWPTRGDVETLSGEPAGAPERLERDLSALRAKPFEGYKPGLTYTVRAGDTLWSIASRFGVSWAALADVNGISDPEYIPVGTELAIPEGGTPPRKGPATPALVLSTPRPRRSPSSGPRAARYSCASAGNALARAGS